MSECSLSASRPHRKVELQKEQKQLYGSFGIFSSHGLNCLFSKLWMAKFPSAKFLFSCLCFFKAISNIISMNIWFSVLWNSWWAKERSIANNTKIWSHSIIIWNFFYPRFISVVFQPITAGRENFLLFIQLESMLKKEYKRKY